MTRCLRRHRDLGGGHTNYVGAERKRQQRRQEGRGDAGSKVDGLDPPQGLCLLSVTIVRATQALVQSEAKYICATKASPDENTLCTLTSVRLVFCCQA